MHHILNTRLISTPSDVKNFRRSANEFIFESENDYDVANILREKLKMLLKPVLEDSAAVFDVEKHRFHVVLVSKTFLAFLEKRYSLYREGRFDHLVSELQRLQGDFKPIAEAVVTLEIHHSRLINLMPDEIYYSANINDLYGDNTILLRFRLAFGNVADIFLHVDYRLELDPQREFLMRSTDTASKTHFYWHDDNGRPMNFSNDEIKQVFQVLYDYLEGLE